MAETPRIAAQIARAIVHLNFNEPEKATEVLLGALSDFNFEQIRKENANGNRTAAASPRA